MVIQQHSSTVYWKRDADGLKAVSLSRTQLFATVTKRLVSRRCSQYAEQYQRNSIAIEDVVC